MRQPVAVMGTEAVEAVEARRPLLAREWVISLLAFALLWEMASLVFPPYAVPGWSRIVSRLISLRVDFVAVTLLRVFVALGLSFLLGIVSAVVFYRWQSLERYAMPLVKLLMAVPVVCWILFAVLWFRGTEARIAFVLVVVCAPIFLIDALDGMRGVGREWRDMLLSFRPTPLQFFTKLILPATLPAILTSWKINLSLTIRVVTMAELVGATSGIGYGLVVAQELFSVADVFAWTVVLVLILLALQAGVSGIERRVLRWRD